MITRVLAGISVSLLLCGGCKIATGVGGADNSGTTPADSSAASGSTTDTTDTTNTTDPEEARRLREVAKIREPGGDALDVASVHELTGEIRPGKSAWSDMLREGEKQGIFKVPVVVIALHDWIEAKEQHKMVQVAWGKRADIHMQEGTSVGLDFEDSPVWLESGKIVLLTRDSRTSKPIRYEADIDEERLAASTMRRFRDYPEVALVEFRQDEPAGTWKATVRVLGTPPSNTSRVRLFQ